MNHVSRYGNISSSIQGEINMSTEKLREQERLENRDKRLETILIAGLKLFLSKGLAESSMKDVADNAGVSRATLYRYYKSKEDLSMAIEHHLYRDILIPLYSDAVNDFEGNGLEKVRNYLEIFTQTIEDHSDIFQFSGALDHYFNYSQKPKKTADKMKTIFGQDPTVEFLIKALRQGQSDGSISDLTDPELLAYSIDQTMISLGQRIASRRDEMKYEFGLSSPEKMAIITTNLIISGLRAGTGDDFGK